MSDLLYGIDSPPFWWGSLLGVLAANTYWLWRTRRRG
jgi:hypothetical protein